MSQPISADQWTNVSAKGTTVITDRSSALKRIILPGTFVGSVEFYDSSTAAGTTATNNILSLGLPLLRQNCSIDVNAQTKSGLTVVATGTPTLTFTWE